MYFLSVRVGTGRLVGLTAPHREWIYCAVTLVPEPEVVQVPLV